MKRRKTTPRGSRWAALRAGRPTALLALAALAVGACAEPPAPLRAFQASRADQLIGGNAAMAQQGDYILENDQIRLGILNAESSPGPGVFGGSLVDADLQRPDARFRGGRGHDLFSEMFPFANLLVPRPAASNIEILDDGSTGERAVVRVTAEGAFFLSGLSILQSSLLNGLFPNVKMHVELQIDYILEPGHRYVKMVTQVRRTDPVPPAPDNFLCAQDFTCDKDCPFGVAFGADGCPVCECAPEVVAPMANFQDTTPVFKRLLGDADNEWAPGVIGGDFVFFGAANDIFAPGIGFDETKAIFHNLFEGHDPFTYPLTYDFMAAAGGNVSYGYFSANAPGESDPKVLVPIITSSSTAFMTAGNTCSSSADDDATCDRVNRWTYTRYFVVGKGDIASIADEIYALRGTPVGTVRGVVMTPSGEPAKNAHVFVFRDPDPSRDFSSVYEVADANVRDPKYDGVPGVLNAIDADVGLDPVEDGDFRATLPPGTYLAVAANEDRTAYSGVTRFQVKVGADTVLAPVVAPPGRLRVVLTDGEGKRIAAKLTLVSVLPDGTRATRDGLRKPYLGEGRLGNGVRQVNFTADGTGVYDLEPGTYDLLASHGPEYGVFEQRIQVTSGADTVVKGTISHEMDTAGWVAGDFHIHAAPSFDSGLPLIKRVLAGAVEGLELMVATDHDVVTDYAPYVRKLDLQDRLKSGIGVEVSPLEMGHFITFPVKYDDLKIPDHGAPDWTCKDVPTILADMLKLIEPGEIGARIIAHPRDGFIGYISQLGVHQHDLTRKPSLLEKDNPLLARSTCDFEAMEVFNAKRFELVRTPTNGEVILYNRCNGRMDEATSVADLNAACPELEDGAPLAKCDDDPVFYECKQRFRRRLAFLMTARILTRTPEEQEAFWNHERNDSADTKACDPSKNQGELDPDLALAPCSVHHPGVYDDWMEWMDQGLAVTISGGSDSHTLAKEVGTPRTWFRSDAEGPTQISAGDASVAYVEHHVLPSYGPFVEISVGDKSEGDTATVTPGQPFTLNLRVQTASWFGVDRIEIYVSGHLQKVIELDHGPTPIVDYDGTVELTAPDSDGFVSVAVMGLHEENLFGPVLHDVPFGELQLPKVASLAFASIPGFSAIMTPTPPVPDFFPVFPLAMTNAIFLDADGDGVWNRPGPGPAWCPRACEEVGTKAECPDAQTCLDDNICGIQVDAQCMTGPPGGDAVGAMME